jgi:cobalt transporter subunit CbtA
VFARILFAAVVAGLAAGLFMSILQQWRVKPLILEAELYEGGVTNEHEGGVVPDENHEVVATDEAAAGDWAPQDGAERIFYTVLANLLGAIGFALVIAAVSVFAGIEITPQNGLLWGLGGFIVFQLAPSIGLAPELPGMPAADVGLRQVWWWGTVISTAAAFVILAKWRTPVTFAVAAALLLAPHLIGAPGIADQTSSVPAHLATEFAANALAVGAAFWLILGAIMPWTLKRFASVAP